MTTHRMKIAVVLALLCCVVTAQLGFKEWAEKHNKVYRSWEERLYREVNVFMKE